MWDELRLNFTNRHMNTIDLGNPGMALYYQKNAETQMTLAIWMICDRELHNTGKIQYRNYVNAILQQFQDHRPNFELLVLAVTDDKEYCDMLFRLDLEQYGYWVVDPKNGTFDPYEGPSMDSFPWLQNDMMIILAYERQRVEAGGFPDWKKRSIWRDPYSATSEERQSWRSGKRQFSKTTLILIGINVAVYLITMIYCVAYAINDSRLYLSFLERYAKGLEKVTELGGSSWHDAFERFQIYRVFTCIFMHAGLEHLSGNMVALFAFGDAVESYLKPRRFLKLYLIAGILSAVISDIWRWLVWGDPDILSVGASGAIFGLIGAVMVLMVRHPELRKSRHGVPVWAILAYVAYSICVPLLAAWIMDMQNGIDLAAHVSGFIVGAVIFYIYDCKISSDKANAVADMR